MKRRCFIVPRTGDRLILVDPSESGREVLASRLRAQGYVVETAADATAGADQALSSPPKALIADLWMPSISGVQLCRLLRSEPATADVPILLRGDRDDPRSRFWAERAGAASYVAKGRMGDLVRALSRAIDAAPEGDGFFMQLARDSADIRDRIAQHLDAALFESVIASEVRALGTAGSFDRVFDLFSQFVSQITTYRWLAIRTAAPEQFALHHHPKMREVAEREARVALNIPADGKFFFLEDEDASCAEECARPAVAAIPFGTLEVGTIAISTTPAGEAEVKKLLPLTAHELGGPLRIAALVEESQRLASIDPLTGLMNRRAFMAAMTIEISRSERHGYPMGVILLDIDHFKHINDTRSHAGGDLVLASIGALLRQTLRRADLAARWGGEEFVLVLPSTPPAGARHVAERTRQSIQDHLISDANGRIAVTASVGLAGLKVGDDAPTIIDRADRAMYSAKAAGRNRVVVSDELAAPVEIGNVA